MDFPLSANYKKTMFKKNFIKKAIIDKWRN